MTNTTAEHGDNNLSEPNGLIKGAGCSTTRSGEAAGMEGSEPAAKPIPFYQGTDDIAIVLTDGQVRHYAADENGLIMANVFLTSYRSKVFSFHFGRTCHYVKGGKVSAALSMTREQFFDFMLSAFKQELKGSVKPEPVEQQVLWGFA